MQEGFQRQMLHLRRHAKCYNGTPGATTRGTRAAHWLGNLPKFARRETLLATSLYNALAPPQATAFPVPLRGSKLRGSVSAGEGVLVRGASHREEYPNASASGDRRGNFGEGFPLSRRLALAKAYNLILKSAITNKL
ncbi:hypothetical protein BZZ01_25385 [Nostocales cyanobacterium HT-58-2]|nr:hypothetical protein BZZ01_25385 [Nostocales cyanobacterium HT-58-2]